MLEKGGEEMFSIPRGNENEEESELEFVTYENESKYQSKEMPDDPEGFERGKGNLLVLERLRAKDLGKKTIEAIKY